MEKLKTKICLAIFQIALLNFQSGESIRLRPNGTGIGFGDPHIQTLDGTRYTFNGIGEYWMVTDESTSGFGFQARLEHLIYNYEQFPVSKQASIFSAFAFREKDHTVDVTYNRSTLALDVFVDKRQFFGGSINGITIETNAQGNLELFFPYSQFHFEISRTCCSNSLHIVGLSFGDISEHKYRGLWGLFDGIPDNDFLRRDGGDIPITADLAAIHEFGMSWATEEKESLFFYRDGKSHGDYFDKDFNPTLEYPDSSSLPPEIARLCGGSRECEFDWVQTGNEKFAGETRDMAQRGICGVVVVAGVFWEC